MKVVGTGKAVRTVAGTACLVLIAAVAATVGTAARVGAASTFRTTDLGTLGGDWSQASALNDSGQVVGISARADGQGHAFSWTSAGGMVDLGTLGGASSAATAVNNAGLVVGHADVASGSYHAFRWKAGDPGMTDLGTFGGAYSSATALSDSGQAVGFASDDSGWLHAASWTAGGGILNVDPDHYSAALDVNNVGQVVGFAYSPDFSSRHGFSWTSGAGLTSIGTLGGTSSYAAAVNVAGEVVGWANRADGSQHVFSWTSGAGMSDVGTLGGNFGSALAINGPGQIVGYAGTAASSQHGFSTDPDDGHLIDLGTLGGPFSGAVDVNASGQVAGFAVNAAGWMHAALFSPPTPHDRVQEVAAALPATPNRFAEASAHLRQALDPSLWNSAGTALSYPAGTQFFDRVKETIDQLDKVSNSPDIQKALAALWAVADQLATRSVAQATSTTGARPGDVAVAQRQLASAEARWALNHTDALERLKQAWRSGQAAVR